MKYQGSCHCGKIRFEVEGDLTEVMACNCSMCLRKGSLQWFVPWLQFAWHTVNADDVGRYTFHRGTIHHCFCKTCGIHLYEEGVDDEGNKTVAVNLRCLENIDIESVPVRQFDGQSI